METNNQMDGFRIISEIGKGVIRSVQLIGKGTSAAVNAVSDGKVAVRSAMPVTEITSVFNTTDETLRFINRETARDTKEILPQSAMAMKTENTTGAWVPWYSPPRFSGFANRRMEIEVDQIPVIYMWQAGDYVYWCNRLDSQGNPAKAYKAPGISHVGGKRMLVVRNDPENGYSIFLTESVENK